MNRNEMVSYYSTNHNFMYSAPYSGKNLLAISECLSLITIKFLLYHCDHNFFFGNKEIQCTCFFLRFDLEGAWKACLEYSKLLFSVFGEF